MKTAKEIFLENKDKQLNEDIIGTYKGYLRCYFRFDWGLRWFDNNNDTNPDGNRISNLTEDEITELNSISNGYVFNTFKQGCTDAMIDTLNSNPDRYIKLSENRYCEVVEGTQINAIIMYDTEFRNGDYPVRIYVYQVKREE